MIALIILAPFALAILVPVVAWAVHRFKRNQKRPSLEVELVKLRKNARAVHRAFLITSAAGDEVAAAKLLEKRQHLRQQIKLLELELGESSSPKSVSSDIGKP